MYAQGVHQKVAGPGNGKLPPKLVQLKIKMKVFMKL